MMAALLWSVATSLASEAVEFSRGRTSDRSHAAANHG